VIASARTRTLLAVTIRSHRLHISIALHCALIGPIACADKSSDTQAASLTDASAAGGTTTAFDPTTTNTAQGGDERAHEVVTLHRDGHLGQPRPQRPGGSMLQRRACGG